MWSSTLIRFVARNRIVWYSMSAGIFTSQVKTETNIQKASTKSYILQDVSSDLTHSQLIKNASSAAVDSASRLLSQTAIAIINVYNSYTKSVEDLIELFKLHTQCLGDEAAQDDVWQMIIQQRVELDDQKAAIKELDDLLNTARKVLENASEAAYISGCEYSAVTANEKLHTTNVLVENAQMASQKMDVQLAQAQKEDITEVMNSEDSNLESDQES
ncbi:diablo IAP-binding mitochondrial protein-like [Antedon mediterranea]|uniref:diablo IAP-binding mitochondrial protein-like n=1 Tax=Antedon mediterranea TaxID=105859 RepID=UPI003AF7C6B4